MSSTISEEEVVTSTENAKRKFALNTFNESLKKKNGERTTFRKIDPFGSGESNFFKIPFGVNPFALVPPEVQDFESYTSGYRSTTPNAMTKSLSTPTLTSTPGTNFYAYSIVVICTLVKLKEKLYSFKFTRRWYTFTFVLDNDVTDLQLARIACRRNRFAAKQ